MSQFKDLAELKNQLWKDKKILLRVLQETITKFPNENLTLNNVIDVVNEKQSLKASNLTAISQFIQNFKKEKNMLREDKFTLFDIANFIHDSKMNVAEVELITYFVRKLKSFYNRELGKESIANIEPKQPLPNAALAACFERLCVKAEEELKISRELLDHIDNVLNQNIPATTPERLAVIMHHNVVADFVLKFFESLDQALIEKLNTLEQISHLFKDEQNASLPVEGVFRKVAGCLSGADNKTEDVSKKDETVKNLFKFSAPLKTENDNLPEKDDDIDNFIDILNRKQDANMSEIRKTSESMSIRPSVQIGDSFDRSLSKKQAGGAFEGLTRNQFEATDNDRLGNLNFDPKSKDKTLPKFGALKPFANIDNIMAGKQLNLFSELPSIQKGQELAFKSDNELQFSLGGKPGEEGAKTVGEAKSKDTLGNADLPEALKDPSVIELLKDPDFVKALKTIAQSEKKIKDNSGFSNRGIGAITETEDTINLSRDRTRGKSVGSAEKYSSHQKTNLSRENVLQIGKLLNTPQRDTAVSNNNQTEGGVGKSEFYLQQLKETLSQRLQSTAKGTTENDTLGKSGYVPNRLLERAVADQMNRILDLKDPDLLTKSVFKEKIDESVFEPRAVTLGKPDSQVGRFTKYETLLPPDYYTFLAKKNVEMDDKKWFLRAHHIESLTGINKPTTLNANT